MTHSFKHVISIHGVPRSGTSWTGEIFNSHPDVAYRFQPLFAYRYRGAVDLNSSSTDLADFFSSLYATQDPFILQKGSEALGPRPHFHKNLPSKTLVLKMVRFHHLIPKLLEHQRVKIILIVRHPCAVINSWLRTPREWQPEWDVNSEWRHAPSKNKGLNEEWFGFERWKEAFTFFTHLKRTYPSRVELLPYESLVRNRVVEVKRMFEFGLGDPGLPEQSLFFLRDSKTRDKSEHDHGVYKPTSVIDQWKTELCPSIAEEILGELQHPPFSEFYSDSKTRKGLLGD